MGEFGWPPGVDTPAAAALAVATFADVMRVPHPGFLCYSGMNVDNGGSLTWVQLGLKLAEPTATLADTAEQLLATLRETTGIDDLAFDEEGDVSIRSGSVLVFVRVTGDSPSLRIHAPLLFDVPRTPQLLERLNDLNARIVQPTLTHVGDRVVIAATEFPAAPFEAQHLVRALREFCILTNGIDDLLMAEFGGRTAFYDRVPSTRLQ